MDLRPHIEKFARRLAEVESALSDPKAFDQPQRAQELAREYSRLKDLVARGHEWLKTVRDLEENRKLLAQESAGSELAHLFTEEISRLEKFERRLFLEFQRGGVPPGPAGLGNTIIEIRPGPGGSDSPPFP